MANTHTAVPPATGDASLILPAFNERNRIEACLREVATWRAERPGGRQWEVILVDDGSTDGTLDIAIRVAREVSLPLQTLRFKENRGKGAAIRAGVEISSGDPVLVSDVDLSTPLSEWTKLAERLERDPVAIGSRALEKELVRKQQPRYRRLLGKAGNLLVRTFAVRGIRDTQCGFKLFRGEVARSLFRLAKVDGFAYDMEILFLAQRRGLGIAEVPVLWFNSPESKVSVMRHALPTLRDLLKLRWIHRRLGPTLP